MAASALAQTVEVDLSRYPNGTTVPSSQVISTEWKSLGIVFSGHRSNEDVGAQGTVWPRVLGNGPGCARYYFFTPDVYGAVGIFRFVEPGTSTPSDASYFEMVAGWELGETVILVGLIRTASRQHSRPIPHRAVASASAWSRSRGNSIPSSCAHSVTPASVLPTAASAAWATA